METKLNKKIVFTIFLLVVIAFGSFSVCYATARWYTYHVMDRWSVDSGKHLDWDGSTKYQSNFNLGVSVWNNYKSGVIREDSLSTVQDTTIGDIEYITGGAIASTDQSGPGKALISNITFSTSKMDKLSTTLKNVCCTHELGHVLGLGENPDYTNAIMYPYAETNTSNNVLHTDDKVNYDYMYNNKY